MPTESQPVKPTTQRTADSDQPAGNAAESPAKVPGRPRRLPSWVRFGVPLVIVGGATILESLAWVRNSGDATQQVMLSWYILPASTFLFVLWWLFLSGFAWKLRLAVFGVTAAAVAAFFVGFRFKEFRGDMVPHFESRWQESAEQKAADYWKSQGAPAPAANGHPGAGSSAEPSKQVAEFPVKPGDWPQFEGPNRDGIAHGVRVRTDWEQRPPQQVWRHPIGAAWSSFAIVGGYAFTQEQRGNDEAVVCYDANTGKQVWVHLDPNQRVFGRDGGGRSSCHADGFRFPSLYLRDARNLELPRPAQRSRPLVAQYRQRGRRVASPIRHVRFAAGVRQRGRR